MRVAVLDLDEVDRMLLHAQRVVAVDERAAATRRDEPHALERKVDRRRVLRATFELHELDDEEQRAEPTSRLDASEIRLRGTSASTASTASPIQNASTMVRCESGAMSS